MITAVDTSVLLDVFGGDPQHLAASQQALRLAIGEGALVACGVVWAELRPFFGRDASLVDAMGTLNVEFSPVDREAALLAGKVWQSYRKAGGARTHLIPDFLVAAHARTKAERLLTRDRGFYRKWFKGLRILEP